MSYPNCWHPKGLIEHLNQQAVHVPDAYTGHLMAELAAVLRLHRPVGSNGKHGSLHTPTCGCEDKP